MRGRRLVVLLPFESVVAERVSRSGWNNVNNRHTCHERATIMSGCLNLSNHTFNDLRPCDWLICCDCWIISTPSGWGLQPQTFDEGNSTTTFDARKLFAVLILPRRLMMGNSRCDLVAEWLQCALRAEILFVFRNLPLRGSARWRSATLLFVSSPVEIGWHFDRTLFLFFFFACLRERIVIGCDQTNRPIEPQPYGAKQFQRCVGRCLGNTGDDDGYA